ncbi:MAG: MDR family MFS transporter [Bacteroidetes bacterium]|nr:MDR family MFS transporter [Bacteroidota bacterium]
MTLHTLEKKQVIWVMIGVMLGVLLAALDNTIVGTAMPSIIKNLNGMEYYSWPFTSYMLCSTIVIPLSGNLGDMIGRKAVYISGILIFIIGSILCGLSQTMIQLIIFRGIQGIGGGIALSNAFAIVGEIFTPRERGKYMGAVASMFGLASILGPSLGGYITDTFSWRWIFYINIPLGIIALTTMYFALPSHKPEEKNNKFDWAGLTMFILSMVPLLLALNWAGREYEWESVTIIGLLVAAVVLMVGFAMVERRAVNPLIPPSLFKNDIFNVSLVAIFMSNVAFFSAVIYLPLFAQMVMGKSASGTGTVITPMMLSFVVAAISTGRIVSATGKYKIIAVSGFIVALIGSIMTAQLNETSGDGQLILCMIVMGLGLGATTPVFNLAVQNAFPQKQIGTVSASIQFFRSLGASIGAAVLGSVFQSNMKNKMAEQFAKLPPMPGGHGAPQGGDMMKNVMKMQNPEVMNKVFASMPPQMANTIKGFIKVALTASVQQAFWIAAGTITVGTVAAFMLREIPLKDRIDHGEGGEGGAAMSMPD